MIRSETVIRSNNANARKKRIAPTPLVISIIRRTLFRKIEKILKTKRLIRKIKKSTGTPPLGCTDVSM
jgi:hypothetical protein